MPEEGPIYADSKSVTTAGTPEALTARDIQCGSVHILPNSGHTVYIVDSQTNAKTFQIAATGITLPINDPRHIKIDVGTDGQGVTWLAV